MRTLVGIGYGVVVTGVVGAALGVGCGNGDDDDQGLASGDSGVTSSHDGSTSGGGGKSDAAADSGGATTTGIVAFQAGGGGADAGDAGGASVPFDITAVFEQDNGGTVGSICGAAIAGCKLCDPDVDGGAVTDVATPENAGLLTVTDRAVQLAALTYIASGGFYDSEASGVTTVTWQAGDVLSVSGAGATFPAFSGSITAPAGFSGVTPALAVASPIAVPTSGFSLAWSPQSDSATVALVLGVGSDGINITCTAADSAGQIAVDATLLAQLAASGSSGDIQLSKQVSTEVTSAAGGATVRIEAQAVPQEGAFTFSK